jgi:hypothetical protein
MFKHAQTNSALLLMRTALLRWSPDCVQGFRQQANSLTAGAPAVPTENTATGDVKVASSRCFCTHDLPHPDMLMFKPTYHHGMPECNPHPCHLLA